VSFAREDEALFNDGDLYGTLQNQQRGLSAEVEGYDGNRLLNTPVDDLARYFADKLAVEPLELLEQEISAEQQETTLDIDRVRDGRFMYGRNQSRVAATRFTFFVPFTGDATLFRLRPSSYTLSPPRATVRDRELAFTFTTHDPDPAKIKAEFEQQLREVTSYVRNGRSNVDEYNRALPGLARKAIETRRERLLKAQNTASSLGYPLRRRDGAPTTYSAPSVRRRLAPAAPTASSAPFRPEPTLALDDYEHILGVVQGMALVLERSPSAFKSMGEEDLRHQFLVPLNGHYEGAATGETFNVEGKTDILIREQGKNIFIAECKFWSGPAKFAETIDQLLGYTSWRDTKTAIILFNRETAFSTVLSKVPEALKAHPNFKRVVPQEGETRFRAVLHHKNDPSREIVVTVLAFDVPR
jgi:hypothetical protein